MTSAPSKVWGGCSSPKGSPGAGGWWWNPLSYVTDGERAAELVTDFSIASRPAGAKTGDIHFGSAGKDFLAGFLLAAAVGGEPIERVHYWLTRSTDDTPAELLDAHG